MTSGAMERAGGREAAPAPQRTMVRAWDVPTRLFHWALVGCLISAWVSFEYAQALGDPTLKWHRWNGYAILILLTFRLLWGFVGGSTARFSAFLRWPWTAAGYLRDALSGKKRDFLGHNPAGGWMVIVLILAVAAQAKLGLFTLEHNEITAGPLQRLIIDDERLTKLIQSWHARGFYIIVGLVSLHILANVAYQTLARNGIIPAMVTGLKPAAPFEDQAEASGGSLARAGLCLVAAAVIVFGSIVALGGRIV
jgi:cytochrome b